LDKYIIIKPHNKQNSGVVRGLVFKWNCHHADSKRASNVELAPITPAVSWNGAYQMSLTNPMIALTLVSVLAAVDIKPVLATPQI